LTLAQALYERHKLVSYPRTDSRNLSADVAATSPGIVAAISTGYKPQLASGTGARPLSKRYVDDSKVSDHHAIIPTAVSLEKAHLTEDEHKIYDLICRRFLMMWHDDYLQAARTGDIDRSQTPASDRVRPNPQASGKFGGRMGR
jgi:DNA topoisomerase-3